MHGKCFSRRQRSYQNCGLCWLSWISNSMRFRITWSYGRAWGGISWEDYWRSNDPPIVNDTIPWVDLLEYTKRRKWVAHRYSCSLFSEATKPVPLNSAPGLSTTMDSPLQCQPTHFFLQVLLSQPQEKELTHELSQKPSTLLYLATETYCWLLFVFTSSENITEAVLCKH